MQPSLFVTYIYQPFFNILVFIYWALSQAGIVDMGIAVIIFAIVVQIILLPLNLSSDRSEKEKAAIAAKIKEIEKKYKSDPVKLHAESKAIMRNNPGAVIGEAINIIIQIIIILMLYRIFKTGLEGEDLHLLYSFMPDINTPINLVFLGQFDLSKTNSTLNLFQSLLIFAVEALHMLFTPDKTGRREFLSLAIFLPITAFLIFMFLPSGKKLFIITSLLFSIFVMLIKQALFWYHTLTGQIVTTSDQIPHES